MEVPTEKSNMTHRLTDLKNITFRHCVLTVQAAPDRAAIVRKTPAVNGPVYRWRLPPRPSWTLPVNGSSRCCCFCCHYCCFQGWLTDFLPVAAGSQLPPPATANGLFDRRGYVTQQIVSSPAARW